MTLSRSEDKTHLSISFLIITLPFVLFYWMMPFVSNLSIGNDYPLYSIQWQMELLFSIKTGSFPLYVPGFTFGHSSSALSLGQIFHPLTYISSNLPGYWDGKALQWNTFLRLLSLGLAHLALFAFLKKIRVNMLFSFLLSCITVYNMRMLDLFRFGASFEAYTGVLFLCTAIGWYLLKPLKLVGPVSIIGATYWLICSGHPSMMYYGMIGAGLFLLVIPFFLSDMTDKKFKLKETLVFWTKTGFYISLGLLLSSAFILPYYFDFIQWNISRVSQNYDFSLSFETFYGTLSNFFIPFFSDVHYAFGGSSLFLMAAILPVLRLFKVRIPYSIYIIWALLLLAFLYMQGDRTPIHRWVWEHVPFASSVRVEGRISIIIPILIMLLLAWSVNSKSISFRVRNFSITMTPYVLLAGISLLLILLFVLLSVYLKPELGAFPPRYISNIPLSIIIVTTLFGIVSLIGLIFYNAFPGAKHVFGIFLCFVVLIHIGWILRYGTFVEERRDQPSFEQMKLQKKATLDFPFREGAGMFSSVIINQLDHSFLEPYLGKIYTRVIPVSSQNEAFDKIKRSHFQHQIFVENYDPVKAQSITDTALNMNEGSVDLVYSSFNRLQFRVISETSAFFGLSYPYTGHWDAKVNGNQVRVYRANGAAHAVEIPDGESLIEFRYWSPAAFWGIVISFTTLILVGLYVCFISLRGARRVIAAFFLIMFSVGFVILWNHSLYAGDNLGTQYTWTYSPSESKPNIAYGKLTSIYPLPNIYAKVSTFYLNHSSRVVDGNKSNGSGYKRNLAFNPSVTIDLYEKKNINSIILHESIKESSDYKRNLELFVSSNNEQWNKVLSTSSNINKFNPVHIEFDTPMTARYIKIKLSGRGKSYLDEVEIY